MPRSATLLVQYCNSSAPTISLKIKKLLHESNMTIPLAIMGSLCFIYSHKLHLSSTRKVDFPWRLKGDQSLLASDTQFWWHWWKNELHFPVIIHVLSYFKICVATNLYAGLAQISGVNTSTSYWHVCTSFTDKIYHKNVERKYMYIVKSE